MRKWSKKKSEVIPGRNTQNYQILVLPYTIYRIWMDPAMWPNTEKWAASDHNFRVLIVCTEDTQFVEWASEEWNRPCKAVTKELLLRARTAPYLAFSAKNRKETKKIRSGPNQIPLERQVEFLHQSQGFIFTMCFTSGLPVRLQGFLRQGSQFILRQAVQCWRARSTGKPLIMLDKILKPLNFNPWVLAPPFKATENMSTFYPTWRPSKYLNTNTYDVLLYAFLMYIPLKWSHSVVSNFSDLMDCSLPGSSVHGIFQARVLEWGAIAIALVLYFIHSFIHSVTHSTDFCTKIYYRF